MRERGVVEKGRGLVVWGVEVGLWGAVLLSALFLLSFLLCLLASPSTVAETSLCDTKLCWWLWAVDGGFHF